MDDPYAGQAAAVQRVLGLARTQLGLDVAWVSEMSATEQVFLHVDVGALLFGPAVGDRTALDGSYCVRVLDGRLPAVVPDARRSPGTRDLALTEELGLGCYVGAPIRTRGGVVRGMLCCAGASARPDLADEDRAFLEVLAGLLGELQTTADVDLVAVRERVVRAVAGEGRSLVLQPIVTVRTGAACGAEALSRFAGEPHDPQVRFAEAERAGLRPDLELAAATDALRLLDGADVAGYLSVNLSPEAVLSADLPPLLVGVDLSRVVVELTEHAAVGDYGELRAALAPHREAGLRLAVDDAGAGYASFRHIVELQPDLIKVDSSLVRSIDTDTVKQALTLSLVQFARAIGAELVAEGVETQAEYDTVAELGVGMAQGFLLARPGERSVDGRYGRPAAQAMLGWRPLREARSGLPARLAASARTAVAEHDRSEAVRAAARRTLAARPEVESS